ncbi:hypothetical protein CNR22_00795 [Sphingobacteriaceae bacterium]|nr:hypothetical protein CNR22_00795 [Sphingobacteriaceae bacterium]
MSKTLKIISLSLISTVLVAALGYFGFRQFAHSIYLQRTCEWANIDNLEMHTGIDIPKIKSSECKYEKAQNTKLARFDLDKSVEMNAYLQRNKFKKLEKLTGIDFGTFLDGAQINTSLSQTSELYYMEGFYETENWKGLLDKSTGKLWITLKYKD